MAEKEPVIITDKQQREIHLIEEFTGKPIDQVLNDSSLSELMRINAYLDWMNFM